ncbi:flavin-containing monooxygenase [Nocardioides terrisoli]|uniref:flavin-containing monooxygenase n=1 Tax=Nocardioides terrisoli TaxID=3388267 RepID=UPI00287B8E7C|nr:NAD(P)/FAD-dependent oxidoreductase [Nocardioides marmorisolisilvae]
MTQSAAEPLSAPRPLPGQVRTLVVGAGFAGLGMAIKLQESADTDFLVIDKGEEVGGTWRDNTYPGAACDVPSQLYSYSFALNPDWSQTYSPQPEIQQYIRNVADRAGVLDRFAFGTAAEDARWDEDTRRWRVTTSRGPVEAEVLVLAAGALSEPKLPDIEGIEGFQGAVFHSAQWDHDYDLSGKRVAVIGTGASAIQIVPELAKVAAHLDVYQRTAPWVMPRMQRPYTRVEKAIFRHVPGAQRLQRTAIYWLMEGMVGPPLHHNPRFGFHLARLCRANISRAIKDPELKAKVTPHFTVGCKRILFSNDWYPALARPDVDLVTDPIAKVTAHGIVTADGTERDIDALVIATGFHTTDLPIAEHVAGRDGVTLAGYFDTHGMQAYKGATVSGFPNMFFIVGPNTGLGHSSMVFMIEAQIAYIMDALRTMEEHGWATVEPKPDAQRAWNDDLQTRMRRTVWTTGGCSSWYLDKHGRNTTLWPRTTFKFRDLLKSFDPEQYVVTATEPANEEERVA